MSPVSADCSGDTVAIRAFQHLPRNIPRVKMFIDACRHPNEQLNKFRLVDLFMVCALSCRALGDVASHHFVYVSATVDFNQFGSTTLLMAAAKGHAQCVRLLVQSGANMDAKDRVRIVNLLRASSGRVGLQKSDDDCFRRLVCHSLKYDGICCGA
jgi:hypothetical protein